VVDATDCPHAQSQLQHTATHCEKLQHTATQICECLRSTRLTARTRKGNCNTLQLTATHRNTRQHTATHCNTLQHTATHCNTIRQCQRSKRLTTRTRRVTCNTLRHTARYYNAPQHPAADMLAVSQRARHIAASCWATGSHTTADMLPYLGVRGGDAGPKPEKGLFIGPHRHRSHRDLVL